MSLVLPTRNRPAALVRTLASLRAQSALPAEILIVDASDDDEPKTVAEGFRRAQSDVAVRWLAAAATGAAAQRNQGVAQATQTVIAFCDDDIVFQPACIERLWAALQSDARLGGVSAMIANQHYAPPGIVSRTLFRVLAGEGRATYAGRVLGPGVNLLPEDGEDLPAIVPVEWLNLGATLYRREALPDPVFRPFFSGYSLLEDVALSLDVGERWKLANARTARIVHDSQPGGHKSDAVQLSRMELVNRHYIMTRVLQRRGFGDYAKLMLWEKFQLAASLLQERGGREFWKMAWGKLLGLGELLRGATA